MSCSSSQESHASTLSESIERTTDLENHCLAFARTGQQVTDMQKTSRDGSDIPHLQNLDPRSEGHTRPDGDVSFLHTRIQELETSFQLDSAPASPLSAQHPNRSLHSSMSDVCMMIPEQPVDGIHSSLFRKELAFPDAKGDSADPADETAFAYIERLLAAIERLRGERDGLRRNVHFLEMEVKIATEMQELKRGSAGIQSQQDASLATRDKVDARNRQLLRRMGLAASASVVAIGHMQRQADAAADHFSSHTEILQRNLAEKELELHGWVTRAETAEESAEKAMKKQNDLESELSRLRFKDEERLQEIEELMEAHSRTQHTLSLTTSRLTEIVTALEEVESERDALHVEIRNLQTDLDSAQQALIEAESRYSAMQFHQLSSMDTDEVVRSLRLQVEELEDRVLRRTEQIGIHQHDIRRLETNLRLQEERVGEMTQELETLTAQKEAMVEDCADAREARDDAVRKTEKLEMEIEESAGRAEYLEGELTLLGRARDVETESLVGVVFDILGRNRATRRSKIPKDAWVQDEAVADNIRQMTLALATSQAELSRTTRSLRASDETLDTAELADIKDQLACTLKELEGVRQLLAEANDRHLVSSSEAVRLKDELESHLKTAADRLEVHEQLKAELEIGHREHSNEILLLQQRLDNLGEEIKAANDSRATVESLRQQAVDELAQAEKDWDNRLSRAAERSREIVLHLELEAAKHTEQLLVLQTQLAASSNEVRRLTSEVEEHVKNRDLERGGHAKELASAAERLSHAETARNEIHRELEDTHRQLGEARATIASLEEEKGSLQMEMTNLAAEIQRSISLGRFLESQVKDNDRTISSLKEALDSMRASLAESEKSGKAAEINLALQSAQHERAMSSRNRELADLRSKAGLQSVVTKLEEQNAELEELLKSKCAEIEENDDRMIEMLKEKKKLLNKIDNLCRKVQTLQDKLARSQVPSPSSESEVAGLMPTVPSTNKVTPPVSTPVAPSNIRSTPPTSMSIVAPSSKTTLPVSSQSRLTTITAPSVSTRPLHDNSTSTPIRAVPGSRAVSGPPSLQRSRTPERNIVPPRVSIVKTPERRLSRPTSDSLPTSAGKKRKVPEEFEVGESAPPRNFTPDCVPGERVENVTPRTRRALSSVPAFTPVRTRLSQMSPKREVNTRSRSIADVTNTRPPPTTAPQPTKPTKRSWLGKIKGASHSAPQ